MSEAICPPTTAAERIDPLVHAALAQWSASISPASLQLAWSDWASHLASSPGKQLDLLAFGLQQLRQLASYAADCALPGFGPGDGSCVAPHPADRRFREPEWSSWPFNVWKQS